MQKKTFAIPDYEYTTNESGNITLTSYTGSKTDIIIPDTIGGIPVAELRGTFFECMDLKAVTITNDKIYIGEYTFYGCENLTVYCDEGSAAWKYCEENNIPHEPIN